MRRCTALFSELCLRNITLYNGPVAPRAVSTDDGISESLVWRHEELAGREVRSQNREKRLLASSCPPVRPSARPPAWNNSAPTGRILTKFDIWVFFENLSRKFKFHWSPTRITGTLHEDLSTFMIISRSVILRMRNVSDKSCRENQNTHFVFSNFFFFRKSCRLWDNV